MCSTATLNTNRSIFELVDGWTNPFEKICSSNWIISPSRGEHEKYLKPSDIYNYNYSTSQRPTMIFSQYTPHVKTIPMEPSWPEERKTTPIPETYCWWFRNPAAVEVGSWSHYLQGFSTIPGGWPWDFRTINSKSQPIPGMPFNLEPTRCPQKSFHLYQQICTTSFNPKRWTWRFCP